MHSDDSDDGQSLLLQPILAVIIAVLLLIIIVYAIVYYARRRWRIAAGDVRFLTLFYNSTNWYSFHEWQNYSWLASNYL